jgi:uncharacterized membrane protein YecN with MAPEG domain
MQEIFSNIRIIIAVAGFLFSFGVKKHVGNKRFIGMLILFFLILLTGLMDIYTGT